MHKYSRKPILLLLSKGYYSVIFLLFLTVSGRLWSLDPLQVTVRGYNNFPPYEFYDDQGSPQGFNVDIARAIAHEMNLRLDISLGAMYEVRNEVEMGEIDAVLGMAYSRERQRRVDFSSPHSTVDIGIFGHTASKQISSLQDLSGKRVIVQRGGDLHDLVLKEGINARLVLVDTPLEALFLLEQREVEYALMSHLQGLHLLDRYNFGNVVTIAGSVYTEEYCFAVSKNNSDLLLRLNNGLARIKADGTYAEIEQNWFSRRLTNKSQNEEKTIDHLRYYAYTFWSFIVLFAALFLFALWNIFLKQKLDSRNHTLNIELEHKKQIKSELVKNQEKYQALLETMNEGIILTDKADFVSYYNPVISTWFGVAHNEIMGQSIKQFLADTEDKSSLEHIKEKSELGPLEVTWKTNKGELLYSLVSIRVLQNKEQPFQGYLWVIMDITHRKKLEKKLLEANKLEALGRMVGGIAHNFNNYLQVLVGYIQLSLRQLHDREKTKENLEEMVITCMKARNITTRLLAFSRDKKPQKEYVDLNRQISELFRLIKKFLPENIEVIYTPDDDLWSVYVDPSDMEDMLLNLLVNARDAMPRGGELHIRTSNEVLDKEKAAAVAEAYIGEYIVLTIKDTGIGMDQETLSRIFDPFFTTKGEGKGTGLGLSSVYGMVKQYLGFIRVSSQLGKGTEFKVYLPAYREKDSRPLVENKPKEEPSIQKVETILIAEDDPQVRNVTTEILKTAGYNLLVAEDGEAALKLFNANAKKIDLVLLDVVMPKKSGKEVYLEIKRQFPDFPCLFFSGYSSSHLTREFVQQEDVEVITKPYRIDQLLTRIRKVLEARDKDRKTSTMRYK